MENTSSIDPQIAPGERTLRSIIGQIWRSYTTRKLIEATITIFAVVTFTFFLVRLMPGNPVDVMVTNLITRQGLTYEEAQTYAKAMVGYDPDAPIFQQYVTYLGSLLQGDLGQSLVSTGTPVSEIILEFLPWTIFSVGTGTLISFSIGMFLGIVAAYRRNGLLDVILSTVASLISSIPNYLYPILLIMVVGVQLELVPISQMRGRYSIPPAFTLESILDILSHAIWPISVYAFATLGSWILSMKSSTISTLGEDYVTVAHARGLPDGRIRLAYVGRNAALPLFTSLALSIGFAFGGSVLIEFFLQYEGIGNRLYQAIGRRDYTLMQGVFLVLTVSVVLSNLIADFLYSRLDPRIRISGEE